MVLEVALEVAHEVAFEVAPEVAPVAEGTEWAGDLDSLEEDRHAGSDADAMAL